MSFAATWMGQEVTILSEVKSERDRQIPYGITYVAAAVYLLSHVRLFATPWTVAHQAPLSMGFPRQEYWTSVPFPFPGDLLDPRLLLGRWILYHWATKEAWYHLYVESKTQHKLTYERKPDPQTWRTDLGLLRGRNGLGAWDGLGPIQEDLVYPSYI